MRSFLDSTSIGPASRRIAVRLEALIGFGTGRFPPDVRRRLRILNLFAMVIAVLSLGYAMKHLATAPAELGPIVGINLAIAAAASLVPWAHRFGEIAGGLLIAGTEFIGLFLLASYLGSPSGIHIQYVVGAAAPFFIFGLQRLGLTLAVVAGCFALHISVWVLFPMPAPALAARPSGASLSYVAHVLTTFVVTAMIVYYAFRTAEQARAETETLLRNILPERIAERLKAAPGVTIADSFESASVLFADLTGFVPTSRRLGPARTVELLNEIVRAFDRLASEHGAEKIKTIGDAYMAAAGVPEPVPDHALRLCRLGLAMIGAIERISRELDVDLAMRIGIASGPVMAGVIGVSRQTYDVWGDTVNLASRLESQGLPGRVQISAATRALVADALPAERREMLEVKGIGEEVTWLLTPAPAMRP